ncbi:hypothetical protein [Helicobacter heilmannii]|uniref:hypothetical protein n=1 Tax=Helicobacter heilmannii TaxID=35817 RepID=UPI000CF08017|nr:hypothetical protein [Helicobacter heilmannii]
MANKAQKDNSQQIQNSQELMAKMQELHEIQTQLEQAGVMNLVHKFMAIKEQLNTLFEKPKRIRRTKAQMQEARAQEAREQEAREQEQAKKPRGRKPKTS